MMPYYDDTINAYLVDGKPRKMTEEEAEAFQLLNPRADIVSDTEIPDAFPDEAADDFIDCSCPDDPPNGTAPLCKHCVLYFRSLNDD